MEGTRDAAVGQPPISFDEMANRFDRAKRKAFPTLASSYRVGDRALALREALAVEPARTIPEGSAHYELERLTSRFRVELARAHVAKARAATVLYAAAFAQWEAEDDDATAQEECGTCGRLSHVVELDGQQLWIDCEGDGTSALEVNRAELVEDMREAIASRKWHERRERGQRERFDKVRACGSRFMVARCQCGAGTGRKGEIRMVPEGCGVRRVCQRCDTHGAIARRARFGRARGRCFVDGDRYGLRRRFRKGGAYTEKMLTLTVPHFGLADARPCKRGEGVRELARDDLHARIVALWLAWPKFNRRVVEHLRERGEDHFAWHRSFEWTPAVDGIGHPHFHVYWFSPFVHIDLIRQWWADALREVGWRVDYADGVYDEGLTVGRRKVRQRDSIVVHLKKLREMNADAVRELMKGGHRSALTMSRIDLAPGERPYGSAGIDGFAYAEGWTLADVEEFCSPDVRARLYMALEGRRLTQASAGFFLDDEPAVCACCGRSAWLVKFEAAPIEHAPLIGFSVASSSRGPPS